MKQKQLLKYIEKHSPFYNETNVRTLMEFISKNQVEINDEFQSILLSHTNSTQHPLLKSLLSKYRESYNKMSLRSKIKNLRPASRSKSVHLILTPMGNKR